MKKVIVLIVLVCLLTACKSSNKNLFGKWKNESVKAYYVFNEDGTGYYDFFGSKSDFKYKDNGKTITITYTGDKESTTYSYQIADDILTIKDSFGNDVYYGKEN